MKTAHYKTKREKQFFSELNKINIKTYLKGLLFFYFNQFKTKSDFIDFLLKNEKFNEEHNNQHINFQFLNYKNNQIKCIAHDLIHSITFSYVVSFEDNSIDIVSSFNKNLINYMARRKCYVDHLKNLISLNKEIEFYLHNKNTKSLFKNIVIQFFHYENKIDCDKEEETSTLILEKNKTFNINDKKWLCYLNSLISLTSFSCFVLNYNEDKIVLTIYSHANKNDLELNELNFINDEKYNKCPIFSNHFYLKNLGYYELNLFNLFLFLKNNLIKNMEQL